MTFFMFAGKFTDVRPTATSLNRGVFFQQNNCNSSHHEIKYTFTFSSEN